jgi:hypothetical protein
VVNTVGQTHTVEPLAPVPSSSDIDIATEKLERFESPGYDQIAAEMVMFYLRAIY